MHFLLYLRQLKGQLKTSLHIKSPLNNKNLIKSESTNKDTINGISGDIKIKCEKAAQEINSIKSFTPWPITEIKKSASTTDIIYLTDSRLRKKVNSLSSSVPNDKNNFDDNNHDSNITKNKAN